MKPKFFLFFSLFFFSYFFSQLKQGEYYAIQFVNDGDTFIVKDKNNSKYKIRLIGIDAPESVNWGKKKKVQIFGFESKMYLKNLLYHQKVKIEFDVTKTDYYGRILAYVYLEDGTFLNKKLVENGFAKVYTFRPNVKYLNVLKKAEKTAQSKKMGLWNLK